MFNRYSVILLIASSYKLFSLLHNYTEHLLNNDSLGNFTNYISMNFFSFLILSSFIVASTLLQGIKQDISTNRIQIKISSLGSVSSYFVRLVLSNFTILLKYIWPSVVIVLFIIPFTSLDYGVLVASFIGYFFILFLEASIFTVISVFYYYRYISFILFIVLYYSLFPVYVQDYFFGIISLKFLVWTIMLFTTLTIFAKYIIVRSIDE